MPRRDAALTGVAGAMCGRFTLFSMPETLSEAFRALWKREPASRYNIAPGQPVVVVRPAAEGGREFAVLSWGLVPAWAKDPAVGGRMINARAETAGEKPSFRSAFRRRRCLVPADGFYEWQKPEGGRAGRKRPFYIRMRDGKPFAIAGLWERWEGQGGNVIESCALLTTEANELLLPIHDRMPVILPADAYDRWLSPSTPPGDLVAPMLRPFPADAMTAHPVGPAVNNPLFDDPRCIEPAA